MDWNTIKSTGHNNWSEQGNTGSELDEVNKKSSVADSDETMKIVYSMRIISDVYPGFGDFYNFSRKHENI